MRDEDKRNLLDQWCSGYARCQDCPCYESSHEWCRTYEISDIPEQYLDELMRMYVKPSLRGSKHD